MRILKTIFLLLISVASLAQSGGFTLCKCDITLKATDWNIDPVKDPVKYPIKPGMTICLAEGTRTAIEFHNLNNNIVTACDKVIIKGTSGQRVVQFMNSSFIRFTGGNAMNIEITGGGHGVDFRDLTTNIEADHLYIHDVGYSGIDCKTDPTCDQKTWRANFVMRDVRIHHNIIKNTKTGEGTYIGESHYHDGVKAVCGGVSMLLLEHSVIGARVEYNTFENIGRDGIQMGSVIEEGYIGYNTVTNYGMTLEGAHASGIQMNPGTNAEVEFNTIDGGSVGFAILAGGRGGSEIHDNILINSGGGLIAGKPSGGGIMTAAYAPVDITGYKIYNNKLVNIGRTGSEIFSPTYWVNNTVTLKTGAKESIINGNSSTLLMTKFPVTRQAVTLEQVDSMGVRIFYIINKEGRIKMK